MHERGLLIEDCSHRSWMRNSKVSTGDGFALGLGQLRFLTWYSELIIRTTTKCKSPGSTRSARRVYGVCPGSSAYAFLVPFLVVPFTFINIAYTCTVKQSVKRVINIKICPELYNTAFGSHSYQGNDHCEADSARPFVIVRCICVSSVSIVSHLAGECVKLLLCTYTFADNARNCKELKHHMNGDHWYISIYLVLVVDLGNLIKIFSST